MQSNTTPISVIISFYNKIDRLLLVLAGLQKQTYKNFEVVIADDGSNELVVKKINDIINSYQYSIKHVWHEDIGWRKNIILNKAVVSSKGDYLIFIDGDCIPHKRFVEEHFKNRTISKILVGRRVNLSESITRKLNPDKVLTRFPGFLFYFKLLVLKAFKQEVSHIENAIYIKSSYIRKLLKRDGKGILGCNFSIFKTDILSINGFDERYLAPYLGEDTDLRLRFIQGGGGTLSVKHMAIVYHCYHKRIVNDKKNQWIFDYNKANNIVYTPFGINKQN